MSDEKIVSAPDNLKAEIKNISAQFNLLIQNRILQAQIELGLGKEYQWNQQQQAWVKQNADAA
jgi:hypothetical protein